MTKKKIILLILAVIVAALAIGAYTGKIRFFVFEKYISLNCLDCNSNLTDTNDCVDALSRYKNDPSLLAAQEKMGFAASDSTRVTKVIYNDGLIQCRYLAP